MIFLSKLNTAFLAKNDKITGLPTFIDAESANTGQKSLYVYVIRVLLIPFASARLGRHVATRMVLVSVDKCGETLT